MGALGSQDIANRVRRQFGDEDSAQITDADLINWINDAQRDISVQHDLLQTKASSATVANQSAYSLPADVLRMRRVAYQGIGLLQISQEQADELIPSHDQTITQGFPTGTPSHCWIYAGQINLFPAPASSSASDLTIYYTKLTPDLDALGEGDITLPPEYGQSIIDFCLKRAYELDANVQLLQLKTSDLQSGLDRLRGNQDWASQDVYPSITSVPEYDYGLG